VTGGEQAALLHALRRAATAAAQLRVLARRADQRIAEIATAVEESLDGRAARELAGAARGLRELAERLELGALRVAASAADALAHAEVAWAGQPADRAAR
jgi:alcohol dehydrogenase class IV